MSMIEFDEGAARGLERIYRTPDVVAQRVRVLEALALRPGERVLDVGVGPGLLAEDMARTVGEGGHVAGIDLSEAMLAVARRRCTEQAWTDFRVADASKLPFADGSFDALVSTQVYEYVADMDAALAEARRVLRPGGRIVILDTDWDSVVWSTEDRGRMRRVLEAWDAHLHDAHLPTTLGARLRRAGFHHQRHEVVPLLNTSLHAHTYSFGIQVAIHGFVRSRGEVAAEEADAWLAELRELGERDEYFFSINRYLVSATKP
jgi:ubiquinone/menaquinone biosynthesis C-methylase UbiE